MKAGDSTTPVTFGLYVENLHPREDDLSHRLTEHREQIELARDVGFRSIVFGHHLLTHPIQMISPLPHIANVTEISGDMLLCTGVLLLPLLNPVLLAEEVASIDWLSDGRLVLGVGLGYRAEEFRAAGVDIHTRVGRFNEALKVMTRVWTSDGTWSFEGKQFHYEDLPSGLKPKQRPHPPLWVAADADGAVRRAGRWGGAWYINPRAKLDSLKRQLPIYLEALEKHEHDMPAIFPIRREAFLAETDEEARSMAARYLRRQLELYKGWGQYEVMEESDRGTTELTEDNIPDTYFVGTAERVAEQIEECVAELGVNHFVFRMQWPGTPGDKVMRSIELVGEKLIPLFASARRSSTNGGAT